MPDGPKVLIGDDSKLARCVISQSIADLGLQILEANAGNSVIRAINKQKPNLVILDLSMPYPDGLTILRKIREDKDFKKLPVIICSVEGGHYERTLSEQLGVSAYIIKPFPIKQMRDAVKQVLNISD